jgi:hypothetical protein
VAAATPAEPQAENNSHKVIELECLKFLAWISPNQRRYRLWPANGSDTGKGFINIGMRRSEGLHPNQHILTTSTFPDLSHPKRDSGTSPKETGGILDLIE